MELDFVAFNKIIVLLIKLLWIGVPKTIDGYFFAIYMTPYTVLLLYYKRYLGWI